MALCNRIIVLIATLCLVAELAQGARPVERRRSLQQLVQPMGAGKSFGTLSTGGGKFAPMAGGGPKNAEPSSDGSSDGSTPKSAGLVSSGGSSGKGSVSLMPGNGGGGAGGAAAAATTTSDGTGIVSSTPVPVRRTPSVTPEASSSRTDTSSNNGNQGGNNSNNNNSNNNSNNNGNSPSP